MERGRSRQSLAPLPLSSLSLVRPAILYFLFFPCDGGRRSSPSPRLRATTAKEEEEDGRGGRRKREEEEDAAAKTCMRGRENEGKEEIAIAAARDRGFAQG